MTTVTHIVTKLNMQAAVQAFITRCRERDVTIEGCSGSVLTLRKNFTPGDKAAYCRAESDVGIIHTVRQTQPGSTWGTDGGSIGGHVGLTGGYMRLHRSGCGKRWLVELERALAASERRTARDAGVTP